MADDKIDNMYPGKRFLSRYGFTDEILSKVKHGNFEIHRFTDNFEIAEVTFWIMHNSEKILVEIAADRPDPVYLMRRQVGCGGLCVVCAEKFSCSSDRMCPSCFVKNLGKADDTVHAPE